MDSQMIELDRTALIGKGLHRECFLHPHDPSRCIKVVVAGSIDENRREARYYRRLTRRGISWEMLARFHGLVDTSLGEGAVFDLVRDHDKRVSQPLEHYLESEALTSEYHPALAGALAALKDYLLQNRIVTMTIKPKNILFQLETTHTGKLVVIDNVGNSDFIPLANFSATLARRKIRRKWRRFENGLRADYASNSALNSVLARPLPGMDIATLPRRPTKPPPPGRELLTRNPKNSD